MDKYNGGEADEHRRVDAANAQLVHQLLQVDPDVLVGRGGDDDVAFFVDAEIALAPLVDAVSGQRILNRPPFRQNAFGHHQ